MFIFFTVIAYLFLAISVLQIWGSLVDIGRNEQEIAYLEMMGKNPVADLLLKPILIFIICLIWILCFHLGAF